MCRVKARKEFVSFWKDVVASKPELKGDKVAKNVSWHVFIDSLCKSGVITRKQYDNWV